MKVLFVSSGTKGIINPIIKAQGESLTKKQEYVEYFLISEQGLKGYLKSIYKLNKYLKVNEFDILHAHYSLSGFVASLSCAKRVVVSLMGDDVLTSRFFFITKLFAKYRWTTTIVKSKEMNYRLDLSNVEIIPNGVDLNMFYPKDGQSIKEELGFTKDKIHLLFAANPKRIIKNYVLFKTACDVLQMKGYDIEIHFLDDLPHHLIPKYMNAADVVCLSSLSEGSPNVIKEAMACNRPIVSTDVGDVNSIIGSIDGCYISNFNEEAYASCLEKALKFSFESINTSGRTRLKELGLGSESIAEKLIEVYKNPNV